MRAELAGLDEERIAMQAMLDFQAMGIPTVDYSLKTWFTRGVVKTMLGRLPWKDRLRFVGRAVARRVTG